MVASGPWYTSGTLWGAVGAVAAVVAVGVAVILWRLGDPRRLLAYSTPVNDLLVSKHSPDFDDGSMQVMVDGRPLDDPHVVVLVVENKSRRDIRSADFDQDKPLVLDFGVHLASVSYEEGEIAIDDIARAGDSISIGPTLIPGGKGLRLTIVTEGHPYIKVQSPLVGVKVRDQVLDSRGMRGILSAWIAVSGIFLIPVGLDQTFGAKAHPAHQGLGLTILVVALAIITLAMNIGMPVVRRRFRKW